MLTLEQMDLIFGEVERLLDSAIEVFVEKAGRGHLLDVTQLLVNVATTFSYISQDKMLAGVIDDELNSAIGHCLKCLVSPDLADLTARQVVRPFLGQNEDSHAVKQTVTNAAVSFLLKKGREFKGAAEAEQVFSGEDNSLPHEFHVLLENTSTEDAAQKIARRPAPVMPALPAPLLSVIERRVQPVLLVSTSRAAPRFFDPRPRRVLGADTQTYSVLLAGRGADRLFERLQLNDDLRGVLNLRIISFAERAVDFPLLPPFDLLLVCDSDVHNASVMGERIVDGLNGLMRNKIKLVTHTSFGLFHYAGFGVLRPPFERTILAQLERSRQALAGRTERLRILRNL